VVENAKIYAKGKKVSLSFLVEQYFRKLTSEYPTEPGLGTSIVEELSGIVTISSDEDKRKDHAGCLPPDLRTLEGVFPSPWSIEKRKENH
jgi:hypothetical protein